MMSSSTQSEAILTSMIKTKDSHVADPFDLKFDQLVAKALESFHVAGLSLAVIDSETIWEKGYGFANLELKREVKPCTLFAAGSTTKTCTAAAVSLLIDDAAADPQCKPITWATPMRDLIPEDFVLQSEYATTHLTIVDCLSHRSGLPSHRACLGNLSVKESTRNLRHLSMNKETRTIWQYSNHTYWAVAHMIELVSGMNLETFMTERLWKPLGMDATFLSLCEARRYEDASEEHSLAKPYSWNAEDKVFNVLPYWDDEGISGSGAMVSNISDQAKWIRSFINQSGPLSKDGYAAVKTPHMLCSSTSPRFMDPDTYGLGWYISRYHGEKILHHPGGVVGFAAEMIYLPERKWGIHLVDEFLGIPQAQRIDVFADAISAEAGMKGYIDGAKVYFFPSTPDLPIPLSLSTAEYLGSYTHLAYGVVTIFLSDDGELRGCFPGRKSLDLDPIVLEHVSGEFFFAKAEVFNVMSLRMRFRFEIHVGDSPARLGLEFSKDDIVWFVKD